MIVIVNRINTIAYKCPGCGSMEFNCISVFDFSGKREYTIDCSCKKGFVKIVTNTDKKYTISMPCIACNEIHTYTVDFRSFWTSGITQYKCPKTGMELCFIGNDEAVRRKVDQYEMQMDLLMNDIGYDDYFVNNTVMLNTIDKIHDIAEQGNLTCQCGNTDIILEMFYDRIELICGKCNMRAVVQAGTNQDLKQTLRKESIVLCDDYNEVAHADDYDRHTKIPALFTTHKHIKEVVKIRRHMQHIE